MLFTIIMPNNGWDRPTAHAQRANTNVIKQIVRFERAEYDLGVEWRRRGVWW